MTSELEYIMNQLQGRIPKGTASNVPQGALGKFFADNLGSMRDSMDNITISGEIPYTDMKGKIGLGELFMGEAPEYIEDQSWGAPFIQASGHGGRLDSRLGDVLGLPLPYAGGASATAALAKAGGRKALKSFSKYNDLPLADMSPGRRKRVAERRVNDMFAQPQGERRAPTGADRRLQEWKEAPKDMSRRQFNKGLMGAGLAAASGGLGLKAAKGIMDAPIAKSVAKDVGRTAAAAIPRVAVSSPLNVKLANLILTSSDPKKMMDNLRYDQHGEYADTLEKSFREIDGKEIRFPDIDDVGPYGRMDEVMYDFDMDEVTELVKNKRTAGYDHNFDEDSFDVMFDEFDHDQMIEDFATSADPELNYRRMISGYQAHNIDPWQFTKYLKERPDYADMPDALKNVIKKMDANPEDHIKIFDNLETMDSFNRHHYLQKDLATGREYYAPPKEYDEFFFEPRFMP